MSTATETQPLRRRVNPLLAWGLFAFILAGLLVGYNYAIFREGLLVGSNQMPPIKEVPGFTLQDQSGATVTKKEFFGQPWIANFIFTRCPGPCGELSQVMQQLQGELPAEVKLASFTVDPEFDQPPVLSDYAESHGAQAGRWFFLTGDQKQMRDLIVKGFMLATGENDKAIAESQGLFFHSTNLVLMDRSGMIRRLYDGTNAEAVAQLKNDLRWLMKHDQP